MLICCGLISAIGALLFAYDGNLLNFGAVLLGVMLFAPVKSPE